MPLKLPSFRARRDVYPADLWTQCPSARRCCSTSSSRRRCGSARRAVTTSGSSAPARLEQLLDQGRGRERDAGLVSGDALGFVDQKAYPDRIAAAQTATGDARRRRVGDGRIGGTPVAICVMDFGFMGGSMGSVVGEKVTRAAEHALASADAADRRQRVGRRADAGGHARAHAAGQDARRAGAPAGRRRPVHLGPVRPDHRRRLRLVRGGRRRQRRRAERAHRVRRRARLGGDDRRGAAAGLPAGRVPVRPRVRRPGRARADLRDELAAILDVLAPAAAAGGNEWSAGRG